MKERYLLFCSTGLGDSIFCTPAIRFLRGQKPDAEIIIVAKYKIRDLFKTNLHLTTLLDYQNNFFSKALLRRKLKAMQPFKSIFFFHVGREAVECTRGLEFESMHCIQSLSGLPQCARIFPIDVLGRRQWEDFTEMVASECGGTPADYEFELPLTESSARRATEYYARFGESTPKTGFQLGASHLGKCWPPENFAKLAAEILDQFGGLIFVNAGPSEEPLYRKFIASLHERYHSLCHRLPPAPINEFAAMLAKLDLLVSNDTGPLHVALSQNVPVVALKSPGEIGIADNGEPFFQYTTPRETPLRRCIYIPADVTASKEEYRQSHGAMEVIGVDIVFAEVSGVLERLSFQRKI